jgi:hypothetical protein
MDKELEKKIEAILSNLPESGETKFPAMTYEQGVEEVLMYLKGEIGKDEFEYAP